MFSENGPDGRKECGFALRAVNKVWASCQGGARTSPAGPRKLRRLGVVASVYAFPSHASRGGSPQRGPCPGVNLTWGHRMEEQSQAATGPGSRRGTLRPASSSVSGFPYSSCSLGRARLTLSLRLPSSSARTPAGARESPAETDARGCHLTPLQLNPTVSF